MFNLNKNIQEKKTIPFKPFNFATMVFLLADQLKGRLSRQIFFTAAKGLYNFTQLQAWNWTAGTFLSAKR